MDYKRVTILCGHYGSGKTNVAVNMALDAKAQGKKVVIADLDIVNPYFRTKDSEDDLKESGIRLICSEFANSNVDLPSLPQEIYAITDEKDTCFILDVGGDERGALALGRLAPELKAEDDYDMFMVINKYRPLTPDAPSTMEVFGEIEAASGLKFTGIINNSNLAYETTPETIEESLDYAKSVSDACGLNIIATTVDERILKAAGERLTEFCANQSGSGNVNIFPLRLQKRIV